VIGFYLLLRQRCRKEFSLTDKDVYFYRGCGCGACTYYFAHMDLATRNGLRMGPR
jgi:hypothetical protein